jgi:PAS domain S-box-containing protein
MNIPGIPRFGERKTPRPGQSRNSRDTTFLGETYREIFEATGNATVVIDANTTIRLANRRFLELSGLEREEVEDRISWTRFVDHTDLKRMLAYHRARRSSTSEVPVEYDFSFIGKNGRRIPTHISIRMIPGTSLSVASLADLSKVVDARRELSYSEQRYRSLAQAAKEIILVTDSNGSITLANPAALSAVGVDSLSGDWMRVEGWVSPGDRDKMQNAIHDSLNGSSADGVIEVEMCTASGERKPIEVSVAAINRVGTNPEILVIARDISEHKQVETRLREERSRLEQVLESADAFIAFFDSEGRYTLINRRFAKALGREPQQVIGKKPEEFLPAELDASVRPRLKSVLEGNQVSFEEKLAMPGLTEPHWYSGTHNPIFDSRGRVSAFVTVMLDITEQKEASDIRLERERLDTASKLARTVAHEFRQPLTALRLISEIAMMRDGNTEFLMQNYSKIPDLVDRLNDLVTRMLYITNLQSKPYLQDMEIFDLDSKQPVI